jgi:hypothetical protein
LQLSSGIRANFLRELPNELTLPVAQQPASEHSC